MDSLNSSIIDKLIEIIPINLVYFRIIFFQHIF